MSIFEFDGEFIFVALIFLLANFCNHHYKLILVITYFSHIKSLSTINFVFDSDLFYYVMESCVLYKFSIIYKLFEK